MFTNLVVVNGHPAISYFNGLVRYARANDPLGTTWGQPVVVAEQTRNPCNCLAVVNGRPAIAYYGSEDHKLMYVRADDTNGDSWGEPQVVADAGVGGGMSSEYGLSLMEVSGKPAIAYEGHELDGIVYIRALDANGDSWGSPVHVAVVYGTHEFSMALINGKPAISYYDPWDDFLLKYVRAVDAEGNTWDSPIAIEYWACSRSFLAAINGHPAISYTGYEGDNLKYVRALDANGNAWGTPLIVDSWLEGGGWPSLVTINGRPAISYVVTSGDTYILRYVQAADPDGANWHSPMTVQLPGSDEGGATWMSLAEVNGHPAISYNFNDPAQGLVQLRYAVYY